MLSSAVLLLSFIHFSLFYLPSRLMDPQSTEWCFTKGSPKLRTLLCTANLDPRAQSRWYKWSEAVSMMKIAASALTMNRWRRSRKEQHSISSPVRFFSVCIWNVLILSISSDPSHEMRVWSLPTHGHVVGSGGSFTFLYLFKHFFCSVLFSICDCRAVLSRQHLFRRWAGEVH